MSLSTLIVQREIASIREVEEALARQVLYGGDLITNLLEVCKLDEAQLLPIVAESVGLPPAAPGELPRAEADAMRLVAAEVAVERNLAPLSVDRYGLTVAVAEPLSAEVEQELSFALALPISQRIAPLVRIKQALSRDYGVPLDRRLQRLLQRMTTDGPRGSSFPPMRGATNSSELRLGAPRPPSIMPAAPHSKLPEPVRPSVPPGGEGRTLVRQSADVAPMRVLRRRRGGITVDVARAELEEASERDTIFDLLFEFTRQYFDYTAVFIVHGETAEGRDAFGDGASREKVARIGVPLDLPGILAAAREKKSMFRGVPAPEGLDPILMSDLGRSGKTDCVVLPVVVRTRVVAMLLGDVGETGIEASSLADVEGIVVQATAAFERLIVRRKLKGSNAPPGVAESMSPGATASMAPPTMVSQVSERPAVEELAPPIRDLMAEPMSRVSDTVRDPVVQTVLPPEPLTTTTITRGKTEPPPPPNVLTVRRPSGRPIPREEPESQTRIPVAISGAPSSGAPRARARRGEAPKLDFGAVPPYASAFVSEADEITQLSAQSAPPPAPPPSSKPPTPWPSQMNGDSPDAPLVSAAAPVVSAPAPSPRMPPMPESRSRPMPASEQQISVALHRPPSSRSDHTRILPSVIVDVASEYVGLVDRVVGRSKESAGASAGGGTADDAETELLRAGGYAMPAIMERFPGPVTIERSLLDDGPLPRVAECGPVLRLVASQRRTALPFVLSHVEDHDLEKRFWATYLLTELVYPDTLDPILARVFDDEPRVRRAARAAARAFAEAHPSIIVERLEVVAMDGAESPERRALAIEALGETRESPAVPALIRLLGDPVSTVATAVRGALTTITHQDFGASSQKWQAWWDANSERHRLEWLIDALMNDHAALRAAAGEELKTITKEYFGYYDDLPKRERERAQSRYREWWNSVGRVRFSRASSSRS